MTSIRLHTLLRIAKRSLLICALTLAIGCSDVQYRPSAIGKSGEVVVVMDSTLWNGPSGAALREELGRYIYTLPAPERLFDLDHQTLNSEATFNRVKARTNVVFAASLSDSTAESDFMRSVFSPEARSAIEQGRRVFLQRDDTWRRGQKIFYLATPTRNDLIEVIREAGPDMRSVFNAAERARLEEEMFDKGRQHNLEDSVLAQHGFRVKVQHDYLIATDTTKFVWLRRILQDTWRSLFVYYEDYADPMTLTPEWIYRTRDSLTQTYLEGNVGGYVAIDHRRPLEAENIDFLDRYAFEVRGLWHMIGPDDDGNIVSYGMGGPFVTYAFYDQDSGRIYLVDGMVFAPNFKKREFLRQLEVIAHTFRTQSELEPGKIARAETSFSR